MSAKHEHKMGASLRCVWCGQSVSEIAATLEPARRITVDPKDLSTWETGQSEEHIRSIMDAMAEGQALPAILVSDDGRSVYDGHHRREAALRLGRTLDAVAIPRSWDWVISSCLTDLSVFTAATLRRPA